MIILKTTALQQSTPQHSGEKDSNSYTTEAVELKAPESSTKTKFSKNCLETIQAKYLQKGLNSKAKETTKMKE